MDMQGTPTSFTTLVVGARVNVSVNSGANVTSCQVSGLSPTSTYTISVTLVVYGGGSITSLPVTVTTPDGGMLNNLPIIFLSSKQPLLTHSILCSICVHMQVFV